MKVTENPIYRFEDIEVDALRGRLRRGSEDKHLRQKAFSVLLYLLENRGRVVSKDELIDRVWNGSAVVDDVLVQSIKDIRRALDDDPRHPRFVRTIPKLGYRFISPIAEDHHVTTTTHREEITHVEFEIEEESKGITALVIGALGRLVTTRRMRLLVPVAGVITIAATAGFLYLAPQLFGATGAANSANGLTENAEALRYYSLGVEKAQAIQTREAVEYLEKAIELDPEFAMAYARIGYAYALMWGQPDKGRPYLERASELASRLTEKDKLHLAAWKAISDHDYPGAIPHLREMISKYPQEVEAYWRLGRVLTGEGQYDDAIAVLRQGLAVDPDAKDIHNFLGGLMSAFGRHDEAIALHQRYIELAPGEPNAYDSLGMSYQYAGRYSEAAAQYQRALDLKPDFCAAFAHLANTRYQQGRYQEAIGLYEKYVEIGPSDLEKARGHSRIAIIHGRLRDFKKADKAAQLARTYNDEDHAALLLALERDDLTAAGILEDQLSSRSKYSSRGMRNDSRVKFYLRGLIALKKGQHEDALENFRQTRNYMPPTWDLTDFEDSLGKAYLQLGQFEQGFNEFDRVLALNPNYPLAHFHLARAFDQRGNADLAEQNYRRFLEVWKDADAGIPEVIAARKYLARRQ